jgi:hypothetical protein
MTTGVSALTRLKSIVKVSFDSPWGMSSDPGALALVGSETVRRT